MSDTGNNGVELTAAMSGGVTETESTVISSKATILSCLGAAQTAVVMAVRGSGKVELFDHLGGSHDLVVFVPADNVEADEVIDLIHDEVAKTLRGPSLKLATARA